MCSGVCKGAGMCSEGAGVCSEGTGLLVACVAPAGDTAAGTGDTRGDLYITGDPW